MMSVSIPFRSGNCSLAPYDRREFWRRLCFNPLQIGELLIRRFETTPTSRRPAVSIPFRSGNCSLGRYGGL